MTKTRSTKSALISSVIALLLCFAMLVGSTFAWFTDSVTSANNIIKSGNLDIELDYWDGDSWETVEGTNSLFTNNLWEPGHTEVVYFKLSNLGSLALKYQLAISVLSETEGTNMAGDPFKLSDYIQMGVVEGVNGQDAPYATREAAVDAVKANSGIIGAGYAKQGNMLADAAELYMAVVVYMPETVGNEANAKTGTPAPTINLGVQVLATQYTAEGDSFDDQYDKDAWVDGMQVYTASDLQAAINAGETDIKLMDDITLDASIVIPASATTFSMRSVTPAIVIDLNGKNITIEATYDDANYLASSAIVNNGNLILTGEGSVKATNNYTVRNYGKMVIDGITVENGIMNFSDLTVESGNISNSRSGKHAIYSNNANLTINGGTFYNGNPGNATIFSYAGEVEINGGEFSIADGTATLGWTSCLLDAQNGAKFTINGGIINGEIRDNNKNTTIKGGIFNHNSVNNFIADGYTAIGSNDKYVIVEKNFDKTIPGTTITLIEAEAKNQGGTVYLNSPEDFKFLNELVTRWNELTGGEDHYYYHMAWTVVLNCDVDLHNEPWTPVEIGYFGGFDGQNHTISNLNVSGENRVGLFSSSLNDDSGKCPISNLVIDGATVTGTEVVGVLIAYAPTPITNVTVKNATVNASKYAGGIVGKGQASIENCQVIDSTVTVTGKEVGGIVGFLTVGESTQEAVSYELKNCAVIHTTVTGTEEVGGIVGRAYAMNNTAIGINDNTTTDVTVTVTTESTWVGDILGRDYDGTGVTVDGTVWVCTADELTRAIANAEGKTTIVLAPGKYHGIFALKSNLTLIGSEGSVVDCINLNGADNVTLKNIEFDAAGAKAAYDGKGNLKQYANIMSGDAAKVGKGTRGLLIDECTFSGAFANGGVAIAFADQGRGSGQSGDITIQNCTFQTTGGYYDIYAHYFGYGYLNVENNTFASDILGTPIYLGRYQSSTPVVVKGNSFKNVATFEDAAYIQAHSGAYNVSFEAADNTFAN